MRVVRAFLLRLVLKIPFLHRTVSRRFMLVTAVDGVVVSPAAPVRYATHDGEFIALGRSTAGWWRPLSADTTKPVTARFKGKGVAFDGQTASGEELDEAILRYLQKYPGEWRSLGIDASADPDEVKTAAHSTAVILLRAA